MTKGAAGDDSFTISTLSAGRAQNKLQAAHLTSSLLEEVLNEKKMALLKSPEVIDQLRFLQEGLRVNQQQSKADPSPSRPESKTKGHLEREARSSRHQQTEPPGVRQQNQASGASGGTGSGSCIWSKEASAFTSVASTSTSGSNMET